MRRRFAALGFGMLALAACTEKATGPGVCPNFCPGGQIVTVDTLLGSVIERDSAFRGYVPSSQAEAMTAAEVPGVVMSRPVLVMNPLFTRVVAKTGDTATVPISVDSSRLRITMVRRDTVATNMWMKLYLIPKTTDSSTTFADLAPSFSAAPVDSVNVSDLLTRPLLSDTATVRFWGDSIQTDSAGHIVLSADSGRVLTFLFELDTLQAPFVPADTGRLGFGIRVTADTATSAAFATLESGAFPSLTWFYHYEIPDTLSTPDSVVHAVAPPRAPSFDSFVFDPPTPPLDDNLAVGGVPSARSLLRVAMPAFLHDSIDVVRATLLLVPVAPVPGVASDSFSIIARPVLADVGAKSPLSPETGLFGVTTVHLNSADTVRIELTDLVRVWALDTTFATAFFLGQVPEATSYTEIRFYSSRTPAFRPALRVTYVKRFPFGEP